MTATLPATAGTVSQPAVDPAHCPAADGEAAPGGGASLGGRLIEQGYVHARFGGMPILVGPTLAAQLKALREKQPYDQGDSDG
jgi:hypothetical protein